MMKSSLFVFFSILSWLPSYAQHNLYKWQVKGYTGIAHYFNTNQKTIDYLQPDDNMWYRLEIGHSLGKTFGLAASASMGNIRGLAPLGGYFTTEARMTSLRLYFYTDNGWLLKESSLVAPYFFGGYGLSSLQDAPRHDQYQQALPFGLGFKFRVADRWQIDFQTEAVYHTTESENDLFPQQNKYNNSFLHTGVSLAYNFGFKPSSFKASRFYSNITPSITPSTAPGTTAVPIAPGTLPITDSLYQTPDTTIAKLNTRSTTLASPESRAVTPRMVVIRDTVLVKENNYSSVSDTLSATAFRKQIVDSMATVNNNQNKTRESVISQDAELTAAQRKAIRDREKALAEYDQRTRRANALRQSQIARTPEPLRPTSVYRPPATTRVYQPTPRVYSSRSTPVIPVTPSATVLLDNDRRNLEEVNRKNLQLRYAYDSLNTLNSRDTTLSTQLRQQNRAFNSLDNRLRRYMQDQANLNDSLRQRLNFYEGALARTPQATSLAPPVTSLPVNETAFDTTVFFNKNSSQILSLNFNNLLGCAAYLKANPEQRLQLTGYADRSGKPEYNLLLSRKRVEAVSNFLQYRGIAKERIFMQYFGEANSKDPLVPLDRKVILNIID
ncbi:hypothetical protein AHMF7616_05012 [Adhaeribacter pallidiroseus]|uniref:OmpA-like domain-containing protein n=2 Tax=Adhaeribacter pallidiroseus TaxID=2072847 RepID=A0A369QNB7_9BACT|nr:hypothetical protein AHMF7616_05012 [Adhaeribacter pallidiroseus]